MCLYSFMPAEYDDLPDTVKTELQAFADVNIAWLIRMLVHQVSDWCSGVAIKMGRRQGATKEHIWIDT